MMRAVVAGFGATVIWYVLVIYVLPFPRLEQIFWERGAIDVIISLVGFCGVTSALDALIKRKELEKRVIQRLSAIESNRTELDLIEHFKRSMIDRVNREYEYLSLFPNVCVSLGLLGTVIGIAEGIGGLSSIFADSSDMSAVKDSIFKLVSSLGVAFDSTLLGLTFSIVIAMIISVGKKWSLKSVVEQCNAKSDKIIMSDKTEIMKPTQAGGMITAPGIPAGDLSTEKLEKYIEVMSKVGDNLASLMELEKKLATHVDHSSVFASLNEHLKESNVIFKALLKFLKEATTPRS